MALNKVALATELRAKVESKNPDFASNIGDDMDWLIEAIAEAVVEHVIANAQVTVTVASVSGVTTGGGVSGPGSGTGTIS